MSDASREKGSPPDDNADGYEGTSIHEPTGDVVADAVARRSSDFVNGSIATSGVSIGNVVIRGYASDNAIGRDLVVNRKISRKRGRKVDELRGRVEDQLGEYPTSVVQAIESIVTMADLQGNLNRAGAIRWGRTHYAVGIPSAILAAGAAVIADNESIPKLWVSGCALLSAILAALVTFLKSEGKQEATRALSAAWSELADRARVHLLEYANDIRSRSLDDFNLNAKYSRIIVELNREKGRLLRGESLDRDRPTPTSSGA